MQLRSVNWPHGQRKFQAVAIGHRELLRRRSPCRQFERGSFVARRAFPENSACAVLRRRLSRIFFPSFLTRFVLSALVIAPARRDLELPGLRWDEQAQSNRRREECPPGRRGFRRGCIVEVRGVADLADFLGPCLIDAMVLTGVEWNQEASQVPSRRPLRKNFGFKR